MYAIWQVEDLDSSTRGLLIELENINEVHVGEILACCEILIACECQVNAAASDHAYHG